MYASIEFVTDTYRAIINLTYAQRVIVEHDMDTKEMHIVHGDIKLLLPSHVVAEDLTPSRLPLLIARQFSTVLAHH